MREADFPPTATCEVVVDDAAVLLHGPPDVEVDHPRPRHHDLPGVAVLAGSGRWGAALVLISIVMILNLVARVISRYFAPKTGH